MSLKLTDRNAAVCGIALSAETWARHAIGGDKRSGKQGFEEYRNAGGWFYSLHYKHINKSKPEWSPKEALPEMTSIREDIVDTIMSLAEQIDVNVMRLQRMEEQMKEVSCENI